MLMRLFSGLVLLIVTGGLTAETTATTANGPRRLASTDAAITETLVLLGVADRLVAVDSSSDMPGELVLPRLGYHRALAAEGLIALRPDLVLGSEQMGPAHVLDALRRVGIDVLSLPYPGSIETLRHNIAVIADATRSDRGPAVIAELDRQARELARHSLAGRSAALLLRAEGGKLRMAGSSTGGGGFLQLLGAANVAAYRGYRSITPEGVLELDPDILVLVDTEALGIDAMLAAYPVLRFSPAVRAGQVHAVPADALAAGISPAAVVEASRVLNAAQSAVAARQR